MTVKILNSAPTSGQHPEYTFGDTFKFPLWAEFNTKSGEIWYACFPKLQETGFNAAFIDNNGETAFIVAGGQGFLIDVINKRLLLTTPEYPVIQSAIKTIDPEYYIAGLFESVYVIDTKGKLKTIVRGGLTAGIYFTGQTDNKAVGQLDTGINHKEKKCEFEFDLETFQFRLHKEHKSSVGQWLLAFIRQYI